MRQVNAADFKNHFGEFIDLVREEPIEVLRGGKPVGCFISHEEYEHLQRLEDLYWVARAQAAEARGEWIGHDEALRVFTERLQRGE